MQQTENVPDVLAASEVRQRQKSCFVNMLDKEDIASFNLEYKPTRRVTLSQIIKQDPEDESLKKYKQAILGNIEESALKDDEPPEVEFPMMEVICNNRPKGNIVIDLQFGLKDNQENPFKIKEDESYNLRIHFRVRNDCVYGLRFYNTVKRHFITVDRYDELMGSFPPKRHIQIIDLEQQQAPAGFLARGHYKGRAMFIDKDGICHLQYEYYFEIAKDW